MSGLAVAQSFLIHHGDFTHEYATDLDNSELLCVQVSVFSVPFESECSFRDVASLCTDAGFDICSVRLIDAVSRVICNCDKGIFDAKNNYFLPIRPAVVTFNAPLKIYKLIGGTLVPYCVSFEKKIFHDINDRCVMISKRVI